MLKNMNYDETKKEYLAVLEGELDVYYASKLIATIKENVEKKPAKICFDCDKLDYVDSMGLGAFVKVNALCKEYGGIRLVGVKPKIFKLFEITHLNTLFDIEVSK